MVRTQGRATWTSRMGEKLLTFLMRRLYMDRSGAFPQIFGRKITFKDRLHGTYKVYGYHVLASAMDTTRLCLTLTALVSFVFQQIYVYKRCFKTAPMLVPELEQLFSRKAPTRPRYCIVNDLPGVPHCPNCLYTYLG